MAGNAPRPPRDNRPVAHYSLHGAGTPQSPAWLQFNLGRRPLLPENVQEELPSTVTVGLSNSGISVVIRGVDPTMSRSDLFQIFLGLADRRNWRHKHHA